MTGRIVAGMQLPTRASLVIVALGAVSVGCWCRPRTPPAESPSPSPAPSAPLPTAEPPPSKPPPAAEPPPPAVEQSSSAPQATGEAPLARLVPRVRPTPRPACPLAIEPGVALGPIDLGSSLDDLRRTGLPFKAFGPDFAEVGPLKVTLCANKVIEVWLEDLRLAPDCVTYEGKPVARTSSKEALQQRLGNCVWRPRIGGEFDRCQDGTVYLGHGMGNFLQVRVRAKGSELDDECARLTDDGSPITLSPKVRAQVLEQLVDLRQLAAHWHPSQPGRDPLRLVRSDFFGELPAFNMFGSPVVWIDRAEAKPGTAYFEVTRFDATRTRLSVDFAYPIEGITGHAEFSHAGSGDEWRITRAEVKER